MVDSERLEEMVKSLQGGSGDRRALRIECAAQLALEHPDYALHAGNLVAEDIAAECEGTFSGAMERAETLDPHVLKVIRENAQRLDAAIRPERDAHFDIFGIRTLQRAYLLKSGGRFIETPQYMFMRVALGIWPGSLEDALDTYDLMSRGLFTHATPTLFNSGTTRPQMSSCFLLAMKDDSIEGIFDTVNECAHISKNAGGIGLHIHNIRAKGAPIRGTGGTSNGLVPMLRVFNNVARYVDQGGGKRMGSFAMYLEPWHADVYDFLELKKNHGAEEVRARDLFYALWIPDLFMERVRDNEEWTLLCPDEARGLADVWGERFRRLYTHYERKGLGRRVRARALWQKIVASQIETGTPYLLYKDAANAKSNQQNLGTIKSSNLCAEIIQYSSPTETAVCNLASVALPRCVRGDSFDFTLLERVTRRVARNLNAVIDRNFYPVDTAYRSNMRHRPMGIGVQGLADVFQMLMLPFDSKGAAELNEQIFETMYYAAASESCAMAEEEHHRAEGPHVPYAPRGAYDSFEGSPASRGRLQYDLWGHVPSERHDWAGLKDRISRFGLRNSLLLSVMPTASTSQILGNNECCEPFTSNIYVRRVLSGEYIVANKHLCRALSERGLWTQAVRDQIAKDRGSVQNVEGLAPKIKRVFRTVWEIKQKTLIDLAAGRAPFICQSQSMNLFTDKPTQARLSSMHFYAWGKGLKTGCYYLRTKPAADAIQFTVSPSRKRPREEEGECVSCSA
jgi:ribonucleoside-diphosphate reductase alpha chain